MSDSLPAVVSPSTANSLSADTLEQVLIKGDLAKLTSAQKIAYVNNLCQSLGLNPLTRPFDYLTLNNKLVLYAKKDCADQLRKLYGITLTVIRRERDEANQCYTVVVKAAFPDGREDEASGSVGISYWKKKDQCDPGEQPHWELMRGEELANKMMRAETKAKRRATLSICGLGFLDESELDQVDKKKGYTPDVSPVVEAGELAEFDKKVS